MKLNEASNMSTEDKMYAWAKGTRKEAIKLAGDSKLQDFAMTLSRLAVQEANKNNSSLAQALTDKMKEIADEFTRRGYQATATTLNTAHATLQNRVDLILQNKNKINNESEYSNLWDGQMPYNKKML